MTKRGPHYWDLDIPGLSEVQARRIASALGEDGEVQQVILCDPRLFLTLRLDRHTVAALRSAILAAGGASEDSLDEATLSGVLEDLDEWLAGTSSTPH